METNTDECASAHSSSLTFTAGLQNAFLTYDSVRTLQSNAESCNRNLAHNLKLQTNPERAFCLLARHVLYCQGTSNPTHQKLHGTNSLPSPIPRPTFPTPHPSINHPPLLTYGCQDPKSMPMQKHVSSCLDASSTQSRDGLRDPLLQAVLHSCGPQQGEVCLYSLCLSCHCFFPALQRHSCLMIAGAPRLHTWCDCGDVLLRTLLWLEAVQPPHDRGKLQT